MIPRILRIAHDDPTGGHQGPEKTMEKVFSRFWWPTVRQDVTTYARTCHRCGERNSPSITPRAPLLPRPCPSRPFEIVETDIKGPLMRSPEGYRYILVIQDAFSKYAEMTPIHSTTAAIVCEKFQEWIGRYGVPLTIHSDRGTCYTSHLFTSLCQRYGIQHTLSSSYHPQANGAVGRLNLTMCQALAKVIRQDQTDWPSKLPEVQLAYNSTQHDTIGMSPFRVVFKQNARTMIDSLADQFHSPATSPGQDTDLDDPDDIYETVSTRRDYAIAKRHARYNQTTHHAPYQQGEKVWLSQHYTPKGKARSLTPHWSGPYVVLKRSSDVNYVLRRVGGRKETVADYNRLKSYQDRPRRLTGKDPGDISHQRYTVHTDDHLASTARHASEYDIANDTTEHDIIDEIYTSDWLTGDSNTTDDEPEEHDPSPPDRPRRQRRLPARFDGFVVETRTT